MSFDRPVPAFSLQAVQQLRRAERDRCQRILAAARTAEAESQRALTELQSQLVQIRSALRQALIPGQMEIDDLLDIKAREQTLRQDIAACQRRGAELASEGERSRAVLAAADCDVRLLDRLAQRQHQQRQQHSLREEARAVDDLANCSPRKDL